MPSLEVFAAAENLQYRLQALGVPATRVPVEEWAGGKPWIQKVPQWIRNLLSDHALVGAVLEYRDPRAKFQRFFSFFGIEQYELFLAPGSITAPLLHYQLLPIAYESDGDVWVISGGCEEGEVFLFENTSWSGRAAPTVGDGLTFAASRLEFLLLSMSISEASYYALDRPRRVMWYQNL